MGTIDVNANTAVANQNLCTDSAQLNTILPRYASVDILMRLYGYFGQTQIWRYLESRPNFVDWLCHYQSLIKETQLSFVFYISSLKSCQCLPDSDNVNKCNHDYFLDFMPEGCNAILDHFIMLNGSSFHGKVK